jgi:hypothetical protein
MLPRPSRETRLLLATIAISAGTLFVLAWFRFPAPPAGPAEAREQPLERLAARAAYDELNAIVARVEGLVAPGVVVLRAVHDPANTTGEGPAAPRLVTGLRLGDGFAVAALPGTAIVEHFADHWAPVQVVAHDAVRGLSVLRVPGPDAGSLLAPGRVTATPVTPGYVIAVEGAPRGAALRPVFLGRLDPGPRAGWPGAWFAPPVIASAGPGVVVTDLEGRLLGMTVENPDAILVPAADVEEAARRLLDEGPPEPGDLGLEVGRLTPALMEATGSPRGAIVVAVRPGGPTHGRLQPADVIEQWGGQPVRSVREFEAAVRAAPPGSTIDLTVRRDRQERQVNLTVVSAELASAAHDVPAGDAAGRSAALGLALRLERGGGSRVTGVARGSAASLAGVEAGDVITWFAGTDKPSPGQVRRLFEEAGPGSSVLFSVQRAAGREILAMVKR